MPRPSGHWGPASLWLTCCALVGGSIALIGALWRPLHPDAIAAMHAAIDVEIADAARKVAAAADADARAAEAEAAPGDIVMLFGSPGGSGASGVAARGGRGGEDDGPRAH